MTTYRALRRKVAESKTSGCGTEEIYKPSWFAYPTMDAFLNKTGRIKPALTTEVSACFIVFLIK